MKNKELLKFKVFGAFSCFNIFIRQAKWGFPYEEYGFSFGSYRFFPYLCNVNN